MLNDIWSFSKAEVRQTPSGQYASESSGTSAGQTISVVMQEIKPEPVIPTLYDVLAELKAVRRDVQFTLLQQAKNGVKGSGSEASSFFGSPHIDEHIESLQRLIDNAFANHCLRSGAVEKQSNHLVQELEKVVSERLRDQTSAICTVLRQVLADELQSAIGKSSLGPVDPGHLRSQLMETEEKLMEAMRRRRLPILPRSLTLSSGTSVIWKSESQSGHARSILKPVSKVALTPSHEPAPLNRSGTNTLPLPSGATSLTLPSNPTDPSSPVLGGKSAPQKSVTHAAFLKSWSSDVRIQRAKYFHVSWLSRIVFSYTFKVFRCVCVLVNLYYIGRLGSDDMQDLLRQHNVQADWSFKGIPTAVMIPGNATADWQVSDSVFRRTHWQEYGLWCLLSAITFSMFVANPYWFVVGHGRLYNIADAFICAVVGLDFFISEIAGHSNSHFLPNLTFFLIIHNIADLIEDSKSEMVGFVRHMVKGAVHSLGVVWLVVAILVMLCYFYGVILTHGVFIYLSTKGSGDVPENELIAIAEGYGSLPIAVGLLFRSVSGGTDWQDVLVPLIKLPSIYTVLAMAFIAFAILGVLNVVTGMFVDFALGVTHGNKAEQVAKTLSQQAKWEEEIKNMFNQADRDRSGTLTWEEFERYLEHPVIIAYFHSLGLDPSEAKGLFILLDITGTGEIDVHEFVKGCTQLKGEAKSLDLASLRYEFLRFARRQKHDMRNVTSMLGTLYESLQDGETDYGSEGQSIHGTESAATSAPGTAVEAPASASI